MSCSLRLCLKDMQWVTQIYYLSNTNLYLESICNFWVHECASLFTKQALNECKKTHKKN